MGALLRGAARAVTATVLAGLLASCGPSVTLPAVPPEIQAVAVSYDNPTGTVPVDAAPEIAELQRKLDTINQTRLGELMSDALMGLRQRLEASGFSANPAAYVNPDYPIIKGSATVDRTCRGWDDASTTPDPAANGTIDVTGIVDNSQLQRTIFGTATSCRGRVAISDALVVHPFLDGSFAVYLEGPLPSNANDAAFIMGWSGTLGTEMNPSLASGSFDFRLTGQQVETRITEPDGDIIGSVGLTEVSLRGSNGTFGCSLVTFACGKLQTARGTDQAP